MVWQTSSNLQPRKHPWTGQSIVYVKNVSGYSLDAQIVYEHLIWNGMLKAIANGRFNSHHPIRKLILQLLQHPKDSKVGNIEDNVCNPAMGEDLKW